MLISLENRWNIYIIRGITRLQLNQLYDYLEMVLNYQRSQLSSPLDDGYVDNYENDYLF